MKYELNPWKIEVDTEATLKYYKNHDDSNKKEINQRFISILSEKQKGFFEQFGVDLEKIKIEYHKLSDEMPGLKEKEIYDVSFLICGKLLSITSYQAEVYASEDVFGKEILNETEVIESIELINNIDGMGYSFKHPCTEFPERFEQWNCGFICGKVILKK